MGSVLVALHFLLVFPSGHTHTPVHIPNTEFQKVRAQEKPKSLLLPYNPVQTPIE
jgi:hypothetical protein